MGLFNQGFLFLLCVLLDLVLTLACLGAIGVLFDKYEGFLFGGIEQMARSVMLPEYEVPKNQRICMVFGNEVTGLDEDLLTHIDDFVEIPQYGHKHSLNVSVTVGVALYVFLEKYW